MYYNMPVLCVKPKNALLLQPNSRKSYNFKHINGAPHVRHMSLQHSAQGYVTCAFYL